MSVITSEKHLMQRYFEICNTALKLNKDRFPFKQILGLAAENGAGQKVQMNIIDNLNAEKYVVYIEDQTIKAEPHVNCTDCHCVRKWDVETEYLRSVISEPERYIGNPAKIDWAWMYDQPGD